MSGIEVAGLVLAVVPLVISALEHYRAGLGTAVAFYKWRGQLDTLIYRLNCQRRVYRLNVILLLRACGVDVASLMTEVDIAKRLEDELVATAVGLYLESMSEDFMEMVLKTNDVLRSIAKTLVNIRRLPNTSSDDLASILAANPPKEGKFAFRERLAFTLDRSTLRLLIKDLKEENVMFSFCRKAAKELNETPIAPPSVAGRRLSQQLHSIQDAASKLHKALLDGSSPGGHPSHQALVQIDCRLSSFVPLVSSGDSVPFELYLQTDEGSWHHTIARVSTKNSRTSPTQIRVPVTSGPQTLEESECRICMALHTAKQARRPLWIQVRADGLLCSPSPTGEPLTEHPRTRLVTLEEFLRTISGDEDSLMDLDQCAFLGLGLTSSLLQFYSTSWLMEPWTKGTVQFFSGSQGALYVDARKAVIPQSLPSAAASQGRLSRKAQPRDTLREMGILLLELWHQRSLESWIGNGSGRNLSDNDDGSREDAAAFWLSRTSRSIDKMWRQAIEACLSFGFHAGRLRKWEEDTFQDQVCQDIIYPLLKNVETFRVMSGGAA